MGDVKIFKCTANELDVIPTDILGALNISYEDANKKAVHMADLSLKIKEYRKLPYCRLPFCHTLEAEALGAEVIFDSLVGNRIGKYKIDDIKSLKQLNDIDFNDGRISQVLEAVSILKSKGEKVVLDVSGPISIATSIMDSSLFYRLLRKEREQVNTCLELIEKVIVGFMKEAVKRGVDMISFADPTGTIDIVGPKIYRQVAGNSVYKILKEIENSLNNTVIHLCGKTSTSLESIDLLTSKKISVQGEDYYRMIENLKTANPNLKFVGHWCLKLSRASLYEITACSLKNPS